MNAISHTIRLTTGYSRSGPPDPFSTVPVQLTRDELRALVIWTEAQADAARAARRDHLAERLDNRAADLREAAR